MSDSTKQVRYYPNRFTSAADSQVVIVINNIRVQTGDKRFASELQRLYDADVYTNGTLAG